MKFIVSADELLRPVMSVGDVADADLRVGAAEDVGAVALAVHPARDDRGGRGVAHGDVLTRRAIAEAEGAEHPEVP